PSDRRRPHRDGVPATRAAPRADCGRAKKDVSAAQGPPTIHECPRPRTPPARPASGSRWRWGATSNGSTRGKKAHQPKRALDDTEGSHERMPFDLDGIALRS